MAVAASIDTVLRARTEKFERDMKRGAASVTGFGAAARKAGDSISGFFGGISPKTLIGSLLTMEAIKKTIGAIQEGLKNGLFSEADAKTLRVMGEQVTQVKEQFTLLAGTLAAELSPILSDILTTIDKAAKAMSGSFRQANDEMSMSMSLFRSWQAAHATFVYSLSAVWEALKGNIRQAAEMSTEVLTGQAFSRLRADIIAAAEAQQKLNEEMARAREAEAKAQQEAAAAAAKRKAEMESMTATAERLRESLKSPETRARDIYQSQLEEIERLKEAGLLSLSEAMDLSTKAFAEYSAKMEKLKPNLGIGESITGAAAKAGDLIKAGADWISRAGGTLKDEVAAVVEMQSPAAIEFGSGEFVSAILAASSPQQDQQAKLQQQANALLTAINSGIAKLTGVEVLKVARL